MDVSSYKYKSTLTVSQHQHHFFHPIFQGYFLLHRKMAKTLALLLLLLQLISFTALAEELETDFNKPDRFRFRSFRPRVPVEADPIIFNPVVNDPIITDPVVNPLDLSTPPPPA